MRPLPGTQRWCHVKCTTPRAGSSGPRALAAGHKALNPLTVNVTASGDRPLVPAAGDIRAWLADWNERPWPFVRTKAADEILDKVAASCQRISDPGH
ncbi:MULTISPECIES: hypothetical protein [unclassified Streptomyces]|uniref:hypothetical protein n=1 Tax=unclassified Streptomyces TaxID=2593676 RepID=UPI00380EC6CA